MVDWSALLDNPDFMVEAQRVIADFDRYLANGADHWTYLPRPSPRGPHRLFLRRVRAPRIARLLRRPRRLAGDHEVGQRHGALLVGVGLLYRNGYFRQTIDADGHQEHRYPDYDPARLPITRALGREGDPLTVGVDLPGVR